MKVADFSKLDIDGDDFEGIDASIDKKNLGFLFDIVSKQMYRRPINSIVREITSNCFDSHIEAKVDDPVVVKMGEDEGGYYILFKDVGVGMSPERMKSTYSKYFSSTKRESNDYIGSFGLGSKSPLAYTDLFYLTTAFNGKKYEYQIHTGKKTPRIDLLIEDDTEERNGTEVKIYIKNWDDRNLFEIACKSELLYFDNVYIDIPKYWNTTINNEYTILDYKTFKFRPDTSYSRQLHIIIGKVAYPISWDEVGMAAINIPVGLKFEIGDLQVTPERESIRYVDIRLDDGTYLSTKKVITDKIKAFEAEVKELYDAQTDYIFDDYLEYLKYEERKEVILKIDHYELILTQLIKKPAGVFTPLSGLKGVIPQKLFFEYERCFLYQKNGKSKAVSQAVDYNDFSACLHLTSPKSGKISPKKIQYLCHFAKELTGNSVFYITKQTKYKPKELLRYLQIPWKGITSNFEETNLYKQAKLYRNYVDSEYKRLTMNIDLIEIDQTWLATYNEEQKIKLKKEDNSFLVYDYAYRGIIADKAYITRSSLERFTGIILYGFEEDEELLRNWKLLLGASKFADKGTINTKRCKLYKIAQRNQKQFLGLKNACYIENFMGDNKVFKRFATAAMIEDESTATKITGWKSKGREAEPTILFQEAMRDIFPPVADTLKDLKEACEEFGHASYTRANDKISTEFYQQLVSVAREHGLYDKELLEVHHKLERYVKGIDLVNYLAITEDTIPYLVDYLIMKGKKVDSIWTDSKQYEKELILESLEKAGYLATTYSERNCLALNEVYRNSKGDRKYAQVALTRDQQNKIATNCKNLITSYNSLIKYQNYAKTGSN